MKASDIMTFGVATTSPEASLTDAIRTMRRHRISGLPVVDPEGRLLGIISEGDYFRKSSGYDPDVLSGGAAVNCRATLDERKVADIMSRTPVAIDIDTLVEEASALMVRQGLKRLPIIKDDCVVGMLSRADILHAIVD
ncbi:CBS domain-containing protein [Sphingopyxis sp.]|uniref:CBS domain-containing protein n=1 Tax=Sphingopyxis sp. TaxID=1908224 RepID=UPI001E0CA992|nr:CBS domain-containing protein [Sphingopyxis sp.]MBW8295170.1 CBS domain-containing protein [Sphingopyxis sp.]